MRQYSYLIFLNHCFKMRAGPHGIPEECLKRHAAAEADESYMN